MFVQDFLVLDTPFEKVGTYVASHERSLIDSAFSNARAEGERLRTKVGPEGWPRLFSKTVEITVAPIRLRGDSLIMSFRWSSVGGTPVFPTLEGELEFSPLGEAQCEVTVRAQYDPPAGAVGRELDRLLLHRIAEGTLRNFLTHACASITSNSDGAA